MLNEKIKHNNKLKLFFILLFSIGLISVLFAMIQLYNQSYNLEIIEFYDNKTPIKIESSSQDDELDQEEIEEVLKRQASLLSVVYDSKPTQNENFGTMTIPRLDRILPIIQGTEEKQLKNGIGHVMSSVLPGENDNSVIAGHRETSFRNLDELIIGDTISIQTEVGEFTYKVNQIRVVESNDETVIISNKYASLTLITCYPFDWVGSAPQRYIVSLILVESILY